MTELSNNSGLSLNIAHRCHEYYEAVRAVTASPYS